MIEAKAPLQDLFLRLTASAAALAQARADRGRETGWWRKAGLLWPLFTKG